ncbi:MAG TPA: WD40 repeat domain-containing serine/threonine protein kinase [Thermoanaerobaculia bacterium]|nr:WD40 repeat domain-containing serine/threonine protein kinase [Thermoanaerobaculia bacterium]
MTAGPGSRLGPYEIVAPLGAGGMGEVYRAKDAKLGREIAIKVLPASVAEDHGRRQRFEQEARSASALNHPNILTIYDIGEADGALYIAMELVEGKTVRELLASGEPLPTRRFLDLAVQIAEGLAKAHGAGIVHRDLKPENLMVSKDGFVKILDFGLAKLTETPAQDASVLPTAVAAPTEPGTVMGTAGYMSPEQASGQPVDYRSDQFSLGAILYEMATGHRAFQRKTGAETLTAIIREEPEPLAQAAPRAPAPVRWIVERCLNKDPDDRYTSTRDLARDLESVRDHLSETSASGGLPAAEPARTRRRGWALPAIVALAAGIALGFAVRGVTAGRSSELETFQPLTYQRGAILNARFAPDGQTVVYSAAWEGRPLEVFSTRVDSTESRTLGLPPGDVLAISSSGELLVSLGRRYVAGYETTGTLARVPLGGGAPRAILENVEDADWSPDGKNVAVTRRVQNRSRLEYPLGKVLYEAPGWVNSVKVSPDGRYLAFVDHPRGADNDGFVKIIDTNGKMKVEGGFACCGVAWSKSGDEVWSAGYHLDATSLSGKTRIVRSIAGFVWLYDIARDGRVLMADINPRREIFGVSPDGAERNLTLLNYSFPVDISRDGTELLFDEENVVPNAVYLRRLDGSPAVRLGEGSAYGLSPDGGWALTVPALASDHLVLLPTGTGEPRPMPKTNLRYQWGDWFPDGKRVLVVANEPGHGARLWVQELPDGKPRAISPEGVSGQFRGVSPDGKRVAVNGPDGRITIYPVDAGEARVVPGVDATDQALRWTADGRSLYVWHSTAPPGRIDLVDIATGQRTLWKELRPPDPAGVLQVGPAAIAENGKAFVYSYRRVLYELYLASGLR